MTILTRFALLLRLRRTQARPVASWRDPRPVMIAKPVILGTPLSRGEAP